MSNQTDLVKSPVNTITQFELNNSECIQSKENIGSTTYYNICNDTVTQVQWGSGDWTAVLFVVVLTFWMLCMLAVVTKDLWRLK